MAFVLKGNALKEGLNVIPQAEDSGSALGPIIPFLWGLAPLLAGVMVARCLPIAWRLRSSWLFGKRK